MDSGAEYNVALRNGGHRGPEASLLDRYLAKRLANPLWDAKQLVLFRNIPMGDSAMLTKALTGVRESFSKHNLARVYAGLTPGKE